MKTLTRVKPLNARELERLQLIRLRQGWSFRHMGELMGLDEATLRRVIKDVGEPHETTLFRVREWLDSPAAVAAETVSA